MKKVVIIGGGISGMLSAYFIAQETTYNVYLIEKESELGGLLRCFDYGDKYGTFDYGAHNVLLTGIKELDNLLTGLLPNDEVEYISSLPDDIQAYSGIFYGGVLHNKSAFLDVKNDKNIGLLRADFLNNFEQNQTLSYKNAYELSKSLFGQLITDEYIIEVFDSLYGTHPKDMDYMSMYLTSLTRIGLFDERISNELLKTKHLSKILAYPNQEKLEVEHLGDVKRALYPKKYGIHRVINALEAKLKEQKVTILKDSMITNVTIENKNITSVEVNKNKVINSLAKVVFSGNIMGLAKLLNLEVDISDFRMPFNTVITNVLLDKPLEMGNLSYFYNYDKNFKSFRIDNYSKYCSGAVRDGMYPVSVEMLLNNDKQWQTEEIESLAVEELYNFGIMPKDVCVKFSKAEVLSYGFPYLSLNNIKIIDQVRSVIKNQKLSNLINIGILSEKDLFFENDVKKNAFNKIKEFINV